MRYEKYKQTGIPWLPEVPEKWAIRRFKYVITSLRKGNGVTKEDVFENGDLPCVRYGEIYTKYDHSFYQCVSKTKKELMVKPQYFRKGDILFSCTGELVEEIGKNIVYCGEGTCVAGGDIIVVSHLQNPEYLNYYLNSYPTQLQKSYGKAKLKVVHIHASDIQNLLTLLPSLPEQRAIVAYLDDKCGKIDELVAAKEKEVKLLKELKQTMIADAVTKGIANAPLRDSGIPWLPQIPVGWEEKRAKYLFRREQRPVAPGDDIVTCFRDGEVTLRKNRRTSGFTEATDYSHYQHICKGDLVIHQMDAFAGSTGVSDSDGMGTPVLSVCTPRCEDVDVYYYARLIRLMGINGFIQSLYRGIRERSSDFRFETFAKLLLPVPPLDEQRAIVAYIEEKTAKIDQTVAGLTQQVAALKEYKQRLIADVVTGQMRVA